jgi:hypothetical protein
MTRRTPKPKPEKVEAHRTLSSVVVFHGQGRGLVGLCGSKAEADAVAAASCCRQNSLQADAMTKAEADLRKLMRPDAAELILRQIEQEAVDAEASRERVPAARIRRVSRPRRPAHKALVITDPRGRVDKSTTSRTKQRAGAGNFFSTIPIFERGGAATLMSDKCGI